MTKNSNTSATAQQDQSPAEIEPVARARMYAPARQRFARVALVGASGSDKTTMAAASPGCTTPTLADRRLSSLGATGKDRQAPDAIDPRASDPT